MRGNQFNDDLLQAGEQTSLDREAVDSDLLSRIPQLDAIEQQSTDDQKKQYAAYRHFMKELAADPRLIALFAAEKAFIIAVVAASIVKTRADPSNVRFGGRGLSVGM